MTREEQRNACIEVIKTALRKGIVEEAIYPDWLGMIATGAFDALHGIARVCPVVATEGMIAAAWRVLNPCGENCIEKWGTGPAVKEAFDAMAAAGDLTNGPETKK